MADKKWEAHDSKFMHFTVAELIEQLEVYDDLWEKYAIGHRDGLFTALIAGEAVIVSKEFYEVVKHAVHETDLQSPCEVISFLDKIEPILVSMINQEGGE